MRFFLDRGEVCAFEAFVPKSHVLMSSYFHGASGGLLKGVDLEFMVIRVGERLGVEGVLNHVHALWSLELRFNGGCVVHEECLERRDVACIVSAFAILEIFF